MAAHTATALPPAAALVMAVAALSIDATAGADPVWRMAQCLLTPEAQAAGCTLWLPAPANEHGLRPGGDRHWLTAAAPTATTVLPPLVNSGGCPQPAPHAAAGPIEIIGTTSVFS